MCGGALYITGGRNDAGDVLTDTWRLAFTGPSPTVRDAEVETPVPKAPMAAITGIPVVVDITKNFGRFTEGDVHSEPVLQSIGVDAPTSGNVMVASLAWECCRYKRGMTYLTLYMINWATTGICSYSNHFAHMWLQQRRMDISCCMAASPAPESQINFSMLRFPLVQPRAGSMDR